MPIVYAHSYCTRNSCCNAMLRHAWTHGREEILVHEEQVPFVLTLLTFNSLGWLETPIYFFIDNFLFQFLTDCENMNKKSMWEVSNVSIFLPAWHWILPSCVCQSLQVLQFKDKIPFRDVTSGMNFLNTSTCIKFDIESCILKIHLQYFLN